MKQYHMIRSFILLTSLIVLLSILLHSLSVTQHPDPDNHSIDSIYTFTNSTYATFDARAPPTPNLEDYFDFINFENAKILDANGNEFSTTNDYLDMLKASIFNMYAMLIPAYATMRPHLSQMLTPLNPSFLRYFKATSLEATFVARVLAGVGLATGCPGFEAERARPDCPKYNKIQLFYDNPPLSVYQPPADEKVACIPWQPMYADHFVAAYRFRGNQPQTRDVNALVFCPQFFQFWRSLSDVDAVRQQIWGYVEAGDPISQNEATFMSGFTFLHELLHMSVLYRDLDFPLVANKGTPQERTMYNTIQDLAYYEDAANPPVFMMAYGARGSFALNHGYDIYMDTKQTKPLSDADPPYSPAWRGGLWNVDNYVSMIKEISLRARYMNDPILQGRLDNGWLDPPSKIGGPHFPVGHPRYQPPIVWQQSAIPGPPSSDPVDGPDANTPANPTDGNSRQARCLAGCD